MAQDLREAMLRESLPQDAEELKGLWCDVFGDPPELVDAFLSLLPEMGCGCVAEHDGRILGAAYLIHGFTLLRPGKAPLRCGYLYAVAVRPEARGRGLGAAVSRGVAELGRLHGVELVCTLPAEESLYRWYGEILSLTHMSTRRVFSRDALPAGVQPLEADEYLRRREALLCGIPHVLPSGAVMDFEAALCRISGGGLYALDDMVFFAYPDKGRWVIPELLPLSAADRVPGLNAEVLPYLCADRPLPEGLVWNLTFD